MILPVDINPYKLFMDMSLADQEIFMLQAWRALKYVARHELLARLPPDCIAHAAREGRHDKIILAKQIIEEMPQEDKAKVLKWLAQYPPIDIFADAQLFIELESRGYNNIRK